VDDCDKVYSTRSAMATHMRIKHQMEPAEIIGTPGAVMSPLLTTVQF
jgi:hypothetical protein